MKISEVQQGALGLISRNGCLYRKRIGRETGWCARGAPPVQNQTIQALKRHGLVAVIPISARGCVHTAAVLTTAGEDHVGVRRRAESR